MSPRALKKLITGNLIKLVLMINFVCLLFLLLQGVFTWQAFPWQRQRDLDQLGSYYTNMMLHSTQSPKNATLNLLTQKKLDQMERDLNDSLLTNKAMCPGRRIGRYLLLDPNLCKSVDHIDIIIIVHTAPANLEKRQRIRDSFAQASLFRPFQVRVAFLLGKTFNVTLKRLLWLEHTRYNDTVMGDFIDDYHNLSLKGVMGYRWVSEHCSNSDLVLKIDDDVLVNMFKLLYSFLSHMSGKKKSIFCNLWFSGTMPILREGKWKVDSHVFSSRTLFPYDYCSGFMVIMTSDIMRPLYEASLITPFFWIDDIYLFGMLPSVAGNVTFYNYAIDRQLALDARAAINCTLTKGVQCPVIATMISDQAYWSYWGMIQDIYVPAYFEVEKKVVQ